MPNRMVRAAGALAVAALLLASLPLSAAGAGGIRDEGIQTSLGKEAFAGSQACAPCHQREHGHWSSTLKATFVRYAKDMGSVPGNWKKAPFDRGLAFLVVGKNKKAAYVDATWTVLPHEYRFKKGKWKYRDNWDGGQDYRERCAPCHLTGSNPWAREFTELGVGCEACHGPGARHARTEAAADILVPGRTDGKDMMDTCRRCHNQRNDHAEAIQDYSGPFHK